MNPVKLGFTGLACEDFGLLWGRPCHHPEYTSCEISEGPGELLCALGSPQNMPLQQHSPDWHQAETEIYGQPWVSKAQIRQGLLKSVTWLAKTLGGKHGPKRLPHTAL